MTQDQVNTDAGLSYFKQEHSVMIRIWHWLTFLFVASAMMTILLNSTVTNPRKNITMVQEQLKSKGVEVTQEQALAVSRQYEEIVWGLHRLIGYGIAFLLFARLVIEVLQPAEEKVRSRFLKALGLYKLNDEGKPEYRHYLGIKLTYFGFYFVLICMAITGLCLAFGRDLGISRELRGTIKEIHAIGQYLIYGFVTIHLIGVIYTDIKNSNGLVSGMFNGNKK
jgi:Ni/Fe-hydrogenase 1 B-type cytochrome subunit